MKLFLTIVTAFLLFSCLEDNAVKPIQTTTPNARVQNWDCEIQFRQWAFTVNGTYDDGPYNLRIAHFAVMNQLPPFYPYAPITAIIKVQNHGPTGLDFLYKPPGSSVYLQYTTPAYGSVNIPWATDGCSSWGNEVRLNFTQPRGYHGYHSITLTVLSINSTHTIYPGFHAATLTLSQ